MTHSKIKRRGTSVIEYAVILTMISALCMIGVSFLGSSTLQSFSQLASIDQQAPNAPTVVQRAAKAINVSPTASAAHGSQNLQLLLTQIVALCATGGLWYAVHLSKKTRETITEGEFLPQMVAKTVEQKRHFKKRQQIYRSLVADMQRVFASQMTVDHLMTKQVCSVQPNTPASEVKNLMIEQEMRHVLVSDYKGTLAGIISDRDLQKKGAQTAEDLMSANPITIQADQPISPAITQMIERRISCLPVVDNEGIPNGVLTSTDLMMALQCSLQLLQKISVEVN